MPNLLAKLPEAIHGEVHTALLKRPDIRIERIVSHGQVTPIDAPYDQDEDEWVLLLSGQAEIWLEGSGTHRLEAGDYLFIPAHFRHRVTWTLPDEPTVWLAMFLVSQAQAGTDGSSPL